MDLKLAVSLGLLAILGFLFYPRGDMQRELTVENEWIAIKGTMENEPLHGARLIRDNPVIGSYDLGYIYRIGSAEIGFSGKPTDYDILASIVRSNPKYDRFVSAKEYYYSTITFRPQEARWVQVVINDWDGTLPKIESTKIGARYQIYSPIKSIRTKYNQGEVFRLLDGLKKGDAPKWLGGRRVEKEVEKDGKKVKEIVYESPGRGGVEVTFDLNTSKRVYGTAITTGGEENNLKQYELSSSVDGRNFQQVYVSAALENKTITDSHIFEEPIRARFIRLTVRRDGWYGNYPELREVEIYTDNYRPSDYAEPIEEHNAIQVYYDNCGVAGNSQAPSVIQGFPFDRGEYVRPEDRYFLKPGEEADAKNSPSERSFCYHYDRIVFSYSNLDPDAIYWVQVVYLQEKKGNRIQSLSVDGFLLHDDMAVPENVAEKFTFAIPPAAYDDGKMELNFNRLAGPNAVVSEVSILQASGAKMLAGTQLEKTGVITKAPRAADPIVIDGLLDEWPSLYPLVPDQYSGDPQNSPCQMYVQWDKDDLFIALKADRDKFQPADVSSSNFMQAPDTLHVFVDTGLTRSPGMYRTGDHHFRFSPLGTSASEKKVKAAQIHHHLDSIPRTIEDNKEIEVAASLVSGSSKYILEARIPKDKALYEFSPQSGKVIGFNYILTNRYLVGDKQLSWSASDANAPPVFWGNLEVVGSVDAELAIMDKSLKNKLDSFSAADTLVLAVWDPDRNDDRNSPQAIKVRIAGNLTKDSKEIILKETSLAEGAGKTVNNSDLFAAELKTEFGTTPSLDTSTLAVQGKEQITMYYLDPYYGPEGTQKEVSLGANVKVGTTGVVHISSASGEDIAAFNAGDKLFFKVEDKDLVKEKKPVKEGETPAPPQISITVKGQNDTEEVTLIDEKSSGVFTGSIETLYNPQGAADGILQVVGSEQIKVIYKDLIQATGNTNVMVEAAAMVNIGSTGLFMVGESETGKLDSFVKKDNFNAGYDLLVVLRDADINKDKSTAETVDIKVEGDSVQDSLTLKLTEIAPDSDTFSAVLGTSYNLRADKSNNKLEVKGNEAVTLTYNDAINATGATNVTTTETLSVNVGNDGVISILKSNYFWELEDFNAGETLYFKVEDADLDVNPRERDVMEISVTSEKTKDTEEITLEERNPNAGVFFGSIGTKHFGGVGNSAQTVATDGVLQVQGGEEVTALYLDELRSTGETRVSVTDKCKVNVGTTGRIVVYSKDNPYIPIAGFPDEGWKGRFRAGDTLVIRLEDIDLNVSSAAAEIFQVSTTEDVIRDSVSVSLTEVSGSAGIFTGEVNTSYGLEAVPGDGILQVQGEGRVNIFYMDAITDTGQTQVPIPVSLTVETGKIGSVKVLSADGRSSISSFNASDPFMVQVADGDLNLDAKTIDRASVKVKGNLLGDELKAVLQETDLNSGVFEGLVQSVLAANANPNDTDLQVREKELVIITYIDEVGVTGEANVPISSELVVRSGSAGSLLIVDDNWRELPNFNTGRKLYFRLDDFVLSNTTPNASARVIVVGSETRDREVVVLEEMPGEQGIYTGSISTNYGTTPVQDGILQVRGGEEVRVTYRSRVPGAPSTPISDSTYVNKGSTGKVTIAGANGLKLTNFNAGDTLYIKLEDMDLNMDTFAIEAVDVWASGDAIASGRTVTLSETSENSGIFTGSVDTRYGRGVFGSKTILEVVGGEQVTAVYYDALTNTGETDVKVSDSCRVNMLGTATFASRGVNIDGGMAGWPLENALRAGDEGSNVYVQWDRDNLYILAYIVDPDVIVPDPTKFWDGADALEIHIDTDPSSETSVYLKGLKKPSYYFLWFCPKGAGPDGNKPYVGQNVPETVYNYTEIETSVRIFPGSRYVLEARIPFNRVLGGFDPFKTSEADRIGFNYIIRRSNAPQLRWAVGAGEETNLPPSFFGTLILKQP